MENKEQAQYIKMTTRPVPGLIASLAVPTVISMLVTSIYNMADTFFVSKLGTSATGAVGIVFSIMALIQAVGFMLGLGSGSMMSRLLGQKEHDKAQVVASSGFFSAIVFGLLLTVAGLTFLDGFMRLLGATETILPYAADYAKYILFGAPIMSASFVLNNLLRSEGKAAFSMVGITFGGILNIGLDPVFIFGLKLGISGAAIATLISQCVSFLMMLYFFLAGKSIIRLSIRKVSRSPKTYGAIVKAGLPSLCRQGLASIATVILNINAAAYGDPAVAAMSIVGRIFMLVLSAMIGFGQGFMPVVGYNYGAKKYSRVREAIMFSIKVGFTLMIVLGAAGFILSPQLIALFRKDDAEVIAIGTFACRAQCLGVMLAPLSVICNMLFQSIGKSAQATFMSSTRQGIFFLPLIIILPRFCGLTGVQIAQPLADVFSFIVGVPLLRRFFKELDEQEALTKLSVDGQVHCDEAG